MFRCVCSELRRGPETTRRSQARKNQAAKNHLRASFPRNTGTSVDQAESEPVIDLRRYADREHLLLASYAVRSRDTEGRNHDEPLHPYRGPFARDRDRILHSSAFRRLSGKMQVFTGEMGIYHRTRLTHTFEVASVARTMARVLRLNEDLTEALALMHDIGHPPYGHCGEDVLSECMADVGGFSHNEFALVIVGELEQRYSSFPGLNLSREVLAGQDVRAHKAEAAVGRSPINSASTMSGSPSITSSRTATCRRSNHSPAQSPPG